MMIRKTLRNLWRHRTFFLTRTFISLSVLWLIFDLIRSAPAYSEMITAVAPLHIVALVGLAMIAGFVQLVIELSSVSFKLLKTNLNVRVIYGDIFEQTGSLIIPVSTQFRDRRIGKPETETVSPTSIHGQLIHKLGGEVKFQAALDAGLLEINAENARAPSSLGDVITLRDQNLLSEGQQVIHLTAFTEDDPVSGRTATDLARFFLALPKSLDAIRQREAPETIVMPLIGSGFGRIELEQENLLDVIIAALSEHFRGNKERGTVVIVLDESLRSRVKLYNIRREWGGG